MQHARLSPSSSARWLTCTASIKACEGYEDTTNSASEWGTAAHAIGEDVLCGNHTIKQYKVGSIVEGVVVDKDMLSAVDEYVLYVKGLCNEESTLLVEEQFDLSYIAPETFGTSDATVLDDTHLHIVDLKTGHNIVYAKENTQLMLYAAGAIMSPHFQDEWIDDVTLHIHQGRIGHVDTWTVSIEDLHTFIEIARVKAADIINETTCFYPEEKACQYCPHKPNCKALADFVMDTVTGQFDDLEDINGKADDVPNDHVLKILDNEGLITSFIKAVKEKALEDLMAGKPINGYKLVRSTKHKQWVEPEEAEKYLVRKLKVSGAYKRTLITPTQAIKAIGKSGEAQLKKLFIVPEGDPIIVPNTDKRPPINNMVEEFDELEG